MASKVAAKICAARDDLKITDAELARRVGVTKSTIHDWTHGEHEPTLASLRRIAKALDLDLSELLDVA